jgi:hypothetical protein
MSVLFIVQNGVPHDYFSAETFNPTFIVIDGVPHDYFSAETFNPTFIVRDSFSEKQITNKTAIVALSLLNLKSYYVHLVVSIYCQG